MIIRFEDNDVSLNILEKNYHEIHDNYNEMLLQSKQIDVPKLKYNTRIKK